jgi:hypothetical protein
MNPFELRFSVFNTAKDFMQKQYEANMAAWSLLDKTSKDTLELAPKFPTMDEVVEKAIEINKFISSNTEKELASALKRMSGVSVIF